MDDSTAWARTTRSRCRRSARTTASRWSTSRSTTRPGSRPARILARDTRAFAIDGPGKDVYHGYKIVADVPGDTFNHGLLDEYYGVSGTDWVDAPILANPSETRTIDGKDYLLFYDGDRLRLVGWKTDKASYWVNNTLLQSLDEGQMLSIATSMREFEDK